MEVGSATETYQFTNIQGARDQKTEIFMSTAAFKFDGNVGKTVDVIRITAARNKK